MCDRLRTDSRLGFNFVDAASACIVNAAPAILQANGCAAIARCNPQRMGKRLRSDRAMQPPTRRRMTAQRLRDAVASVWANAAQRSLCLVCDARCMVCGARLCPVQRVLCGMSCVVCSAGCWCVVCGVCVWCIMCSVRCARARCVVWCVVSGGRATVFDLIAVYAVTWFVALPPAL